MKLMLTLGAAGFLSWAGVAMAQVTVVEARPAAQATPTQQAAAPASAQQTDLYFRLQALQQEVLELRGLVEEQSFEIKRLKQQRQEDYLDLDRRISAFSGGAGAGSAAADIPIKADNADDGAAYKGAYGKLRERDLAGAAEGFKQYLAQFPKGQYAANSQYWLGEIYLVEGKLEQARQWFERVTQDFPSSRKAPDAKFKLGTVLFQLGQKDKARALLQQVAASNADAARLAKDYLNQNF
ncbi:tol-pal system protein YbgF [Simiduia sp. 21SJ11W-1]|uniref:tol-pal system protein YbgF n=1 Tax=Simiduia sp. 21SJ11W-1 TaxID=2909669 RepID=UPI0020A0E599|nr:tol-pal system protein YbgF [Simiduia sp. 21SJ11W-1]UTA49107.1 tol-pal system protein YbgF [Simiduia sp. 21SJ11W-1]